MSKFEVGYIEVRGTPLFCSERFFSPEQERIYGYKDSVRQDKALYPAFLPLAAFVLDDLEIVFGDDLVWTDKAKEHRDYLIELQRKWDTNTLPQDFTAPLEPFEHQKEGISAALYNHRHCIFHDCGLGKTKTMIDTWRVLKQRDSDFKALLLCPSHLGVNWEREVSKHTFEGELRVIKMMDNNNTSLPVEDRISLYTGERSVNPDPDSKFYEEYPNLYYEPLPEGLPGDIYKHERDYVEAIVNDDSDARSKARSKMSYRARKHGFDLTDARSARMLDPTPEPVKEYDVLIVSYDTAAIDEDYIKEHFPYTTIAADESHYLGGYKSNRTKASCRLSKYASRRYLLSGTPSLGKPMHLYGQLRFLSPILTEGWFRYTRRYNVYAKHNENMVVGYKNLHVLNMVVNQVAHRRKREECMDLPPVYTVDVPVELDDHTKNMYNDLVSTWSTKLTEQRTVEVQQAPDRLNKLLQVLSGFYIDSNKDHELCEGCPHLMDCVAQNIKPYTPLCKVEQKDPPKKTVRLKTQPRLNECEALVESILQEETNKIIIWCQYTEELNMVEEMLNENNVGYVRVDGNTRNKVDCEDQFREDEECRVYLSHISICEGLTLNSANYVIYYGLTYDLKEYIQSKKRNDRAGQTRPVTIYRLVTKGSIHEYVIRSLEQKKDLADSMTDTIRCGMCEFHEFCDKNGVEPFDEDCVYDKKETRVVTRPSLLK